MKKKRTCYKCGKILSSEGEFCNYCGAWVRTEILRPSNREKNKLPNIPIRKITAFLRNNKRKVRIWAFSCLLVLLLGSALYFLGKQSIIRLDTEMNSKDVLVSDLNTLPDSSSQYEEPETGTVFVGKYSPRDSELRIITSNQSAYIKLRDKDDQVVFSFYVRKNSDLTIKVPAMLLHIYFAMGDQWCGNRDCFGPSTVYYKDDLLKDFSNYTYTYDFNKSFSGNFDPATIKGSDF